MQSSPWITGDDPSIAGAHQASLLTRSIWAVRKRFWNAIATLKFRHNKPVAVPVPRGDRRLNPVILADQFPGIPVSNILVADRVPADEASPVVDGFYRLQVALYRLFPPMQRGLPPIDADPRRALDEAYTLAHRRLFPAPLLPEEYRRQVDLGHIAVAGPYAFYLERAPEGGFQWDLRKLGRYEHHEGLRSLGVRVLFEVDDRARRLRATRIECELGVAVPGDERWELAQKMALCAVTTHLSLVRHFNWIHLAAGGPLAIATRNDLPPDHPLRRLLWPHVHHTQLSNRVITLGQMAKGGDFETTFSFTHRGMCQLYEETYAEYDAIVIDPVREAERRGLLDAGFDTPTLANRIAHFELMCRHAERYLHVYYDSDRQLQEDVSFQAWLEEWDRLVPNGVRKLLPDEITIDSAARLFGAIIYLVTVEHEVVGTGLWNYQPWTHVQPVRIYRNGQREPLDVYQRLINANYNLNVHRTQLLTDFSYLALDPRGAEAFRQFRADLLALQSKLEKEPAAYWKVHPTILEANINA
ncbi:lipoxygenase family protein [Sorangium sp. So ce693]|uniref:lipoxygenase family protein n=1 Tax=Sorangium sp. So ce693 TaxID=3133318 RepID=UPI003F5E8E57